MSKASESADSDFRWHRSGLVDNLTPSGCGGVKTWYSLLF
jgi:hypothetical protein